MKSNISQLNQNADNLRCGAVLMSRCIFAFRWDKIAQEFGLKRFWVDPTEQFASGTNRVKD